jgi:F0F1-type ATP synthase delta subunit
MFRSDRWAAAFTGLCGEDLDEGVEAFTTFVSGTAKAGNRLSGTVDALRFEALSRTALLETGFGPVNRGTELALRFTVLLMKKGCFKYRLALLKEIERAADRMRGTLRVVLESAVPPDQGLEDAIKTALTREAGSVVIDKRVVPELIAGYRLYIGTELVDTSLRGSIRKMAADLGVHVCRGTGIGIDDVLVWENI